MSGFIEWLEGVNRRDSKAKSILKRSLAFDPGTFPSAFPYVEPFIRDEDRQWKRAVYYLVAGLWALHWRDGRTGQPLSFGKACAAFQRASGTANIERRLITLLDADRDQLPHRLRQLVSLLKEQVVDFDALLKGLVVWDSDDKRTQNAWARDFYRNIEIGNNIGNEKEENS